MKRAFLAVAAMTVVAGSLAACATGPTPASGSAPGSASGVATASSATPAAKLRMTSNNGHELAFYVTPGNLPAIVLDAGGGLDHSYWKDIVPALAAKTGSEIITYDRSGEGKSSEVAGAFSPAVAAEDLASGLTQIGVRDDIVLASHSVAGEVATYFANQHPNRVSAAVLIDASLPQFYTATETARIVAANTPQIAALEKQPKTRQTRQLIAAAENYGPVHTAYHAMTWPDSIPVIAITSSKTPFDTAIDAGLWHAAQKEFVGVASNRRLLTTESSHDIPIDQPALVIDQIEDMLAQLG